MAWTAVLALVFLAGSAVAPVLLSAGNGWGAVVHLAYSPLCHQLPERSLTVGSGAQAVCARCCGLYLGGIVGLWAAGRWALHRRWRPRPWWLAASIAPSAVDFALPWLGLPSLPNVPRLILALPAGFVAAWFLAIGLEDLFSRAGRFRLRGRLVHHDSRALEEIDG